MAAMQVNSAVRDTMLRRLHEETENWLEANLTELDAVMSVPPTPAPKPKAPRGEGGAALKTLLERCKFLAVQRVPEWHRTMDRDSLQLFFDTVLDVTRRCVVEDDTNEAWCASMEREAALELELAAKHKRGTCLWRADSDRETRLGLASENYNPATGENRHLARALAAGRHQRERVRELTERFRDENPEWLLNVKVINEGLPSVVPLEDDNEFVEWYRVRLFRIVMFSHYSMAGNVSEMRYWRSLSDDQVRTLRNDSLLAKKVCGQPVNTRPFRFQWSRELDASGNTVDLSVEAFWKTAPHQLTQPVAPTVPRPDTLRPLLLR
jgi:hypothetical protein